MNRIYAVIIVLAFSLTVAAAAAEAEERPTQRDWIVGLVEGMGWSFGLPEEPTDADYLAILSGNRLLRIEAERAKGETDPVSVKSFKTFGPFSGEGWVSGSTRPSTVHLRFLLPIGGVYTLSAALRLPGHEISAGDRIFAIDGENTFREYTLGDVDLIAGEQEILVTIPPNGSLDYIQLQAPPLPPVTPLGGWNTDAPLTTADMAVTAIRLLGLEAFLPPTGQVLDYEAEESTRTGRAEKTDIRHLGQPSGNLWLRAGASPSTETINFDLPEGGVYTLLLRAESSSPLTVTLNTRFTSKMEFPQYLKALPLGSFFLDSGENHLEVNLPPRAGIDLLTLEKKRSEDNDFCRLVGLPAIGTEPDPAMMDAMISLLSTMAPPR